MPPTSMLLILSCLAAAVQEDRHLQGHSSRVETLDFSMDGKELISDGADSVILWDLAPGNNPRRILPPSPVGVGDGIRRFGILFSPKKSWFWSNSLQGFFDFSTGAPVSLPKKPPHRIVAVSPVGNMVATFGEVGQRMQGQGEVPRLPILVGGIILWDIAKSSAVGQWEITSFEGLPDIRVSFDPTGKTLMTWVMCGSPKITAWDVDLHKHIREIEDEGMKGAFFSTDGRSFLCAVDRRIRTWATDTWKESPSTELKNFRRLETTEKGDRITPDELRGYAGSGIKEGANARIRSFAFRPDGRVFAIGLSDGSIRRWDLKTGNELGKLPDQKSPVTAMAFSPDGDILATGSENGTILLRSVKKE